MSDNKRQEPPRRGGMNQGPNAAAMPGEKAKDFKGTWKKMLRYLSGYMPAIVACLLIAMGSSIFTILGPRILVGATDELFNGLLEMITGADAGGDGIVGINFDVILRVLIFCGIIYVVSAVLMYVQGFILNNIACKISYRMREELSSKIDRMPLSYFDRVPYGDVLSRITNDVDTLTQTFNQSLPQMVSSITSIIGVCIMMFTINVWMTLVTLLVLPLSMLFVSKIVKRSRPHFQHQQDYIGKANAKVEEMYAGHAVVKAFNREEVAEEEFDEINKELYKSAWKSQFWGGIMMPVINFVGNLGYVIVVVLGGFFTLVGSISVGEIQAFIQYVRSFTQPISQIANASNVLQQTAAAAERVFEFLDEEEETADAQDAAELPKEDYSVKFEDISFGYLPEKTIIHNFSVDVKQGQQVAIVGPTGAGKTTMVKLLMRFYDVNSGAVYVGGEDVRRYHRGELRGMFGMVLQETWLYNDTIMENIRYGRLDASDEEVVAAAKAAQADRFIRTLPDGYNMVLNESASNISQGQKQLLTIARTILSEPKIMILDEATSSVDTRTEMAIQKAMKQLMQNRTSFVIAHRLSTIRDADMILVMRDGDIVETGNHVELLAKGGFYAELYNSQFEQSEAI